MRIRIWAVAVLLLSAGSLLCLAPAFAQSSGPTGKLKVCVCPRQAYVFVDGKALRDGTQTMKLAAGDHTVSVHNYGYQPYTQSVHVLAGKKKYLSVGLQPSGDKVSGPFGEIEFKGHPRAAVLLDGDKPGYFVGHVDEFDNEWIWHQRLLVKPGKYQVTVERGGNTIWSGPITAMAGQHVTVYLNQNGETKTQAWKEGLTLGPQPRFRAGIASATVAVAPVAAQMTAQRHNLACGQSTSLNWNTMNAVDTSIASIGPVAAKGDRTVTPKQDITYVLTAKGPGGEATQTVTVDVNTRPAATLALSQPEVRYHKIGDKVVNQDSATLNWSASNATSATVEPFGASSMSGTRTITAEPGQTATGPINQEITYTFTASNACGGTVTKTATLHVIGSIDPAPPVALASVFYPTAYPTKRHPKVGLVADEKEVLEKLAKNFNSHEQYDEQALLLVVGHADVRGSRTYNQALSERRAAEIKAFIVSQGVPSDKIQTRAAGKDQQIAEGKVESLQSQDPEKPEEWESRHMRTTWLAYNRRGDIILEPKGQLSEEEYPNDVSEARILWQRPIPSLRAVDCASAMPGGTQQARVGSPGI